VTDLQQQLDLVVMIQQAFQAMGISGFQSVRDMQDILMGRASMTKAGRELGIDDAAVREASQQGQLVEYLTKKLGGFAEAGAAASHTLNNEVVRLNNELGQLKQIATQDLLEPLTDGVARLNQFLGDSRDATVCGRNWLNCRCDCAHTKGHT
jgi:hypothetical protein